MLPCLTSSRPWLRPPLRAQPRAGCWTSCSAAIPSARWRPILYVLLRNNRIRYFPAILGEFRKTIDARLGLVRARVTSAAPLGEPELKRMEAGLSRFTGARVQVEPRTDPGLLGGCVVEIGSTVYDGSIRTRLEEMKRRLAENHRESRSETRQD